jgi:predicted ribonuclease YlaK
MTRRTHDRRVRVTEDFKKTMVLDTNGLMDDTMAIFRFGECNVFIATRVVAELDHNKRDKTDGKNCRDTISLFEKILRGKMKEEIEDGIPLSPIFLSTVNESGRKVEAPPTGLIFFQTRAPEKTSLLFPEDDSDNKILSVILDLKSCGRNITLVTNDENFRIKATLEGISTIPYEGEHRGAKKRPWKRGYQDHTSKRHRPYWGGKK